MSGSVVDAKREKYTVPAQKEVRFMKDTDKYIHDYGVVWHDDERGPQLGQRLEVSGNQRKIPLNLVWKINGS